MPSPEAVREEIAVLERRLADLRAELDDPTTVRRFDGATYNHSQDGIRLSRQFERVRDLMLDGRWRTLREIATILNLPEPSVSARLRDLRKPRFGGFKVEHERLDGGLWRYRLIDIARIEDVRQMVSPSPVVSDGVAGSGRSALGHAALGHTATPSETTATPRLAIFDEDWA